MLQLWDDGPFCARMPIRKQKWWYFFSFIKVPSEAEAVIAQDQTPETTSLEDEEEAQAKAARNSEAATRRRKNARTNPKTVTKRERRNIKNIEDHHQTPGQIDK